MSNDKMREISRTEFEEKFPLPSGVAWKESIGMYEVVDIWKLDRPMTIGQYNWLWEGWQASRAGFPDMTAARAAIRQALPNVPGDSLDHGLIAAFEAAGLGVRS